MPTHGVQATSLWSVTAPSTLVTNAANTWVGLVVTFPAPGRVVGFRNYRTSSTGSVHWGQLINRTTLTLLACHGFMDDALTTSRWQNVWIHPWIRINTTDTFYVAVAYPASNYYRTASALTSPLTNGGITAVHGFQSTVWDLSSASPTTNANANGVDLLFQAD
jgi:hypothetical protein